MGRAIGSRYELDDEIGRGAFGAVWRGRVRATGEAVAIKVLLEEFAADADVVTRFLRERAALVGLNHRSLVRLRDLVVEGDILALVMQLVEGPDLKKYLAGRGRLAPDEAGLLVAEVAEGMAVAHSAGIVHRDIKPANVLLEQADGGLRPLLTDFGIARIADAPSVTRTHQVVGTPYYLAPEVVAGKKATPAADVYAAGIMLYELITGHPVFRGPDAVSVFRQHMNTVPERPAEIPQRLWPVIAAALVKEPEARPSAPVLAAQLRAAVGKVMDGPDGEPTHHLPIEHRYGTLRLPPITAAGYPGSGSGAGSAVGAAAGAGAEGPSGDVSMPTPGDGAPASAGAPTTAMPVSPGAAPASAGAPTTAMPAVSPAAAAAAAAAASAAAADIEPTVPVVRPANLPAPLPQRPQRADGRIAGWDAPSEPDAIGAGVSRRQPGPPQPQPLPTQMQRQLDQLHQERQPDPRQGQAHQRLSAYPPQPQFAPQGYQQPGPQGYQQPAPGQPYQAPGGRYQDQGGRYQDQYQDQGGYQPSQFQASAAAPPRPVAYTPNQPPVMPPRQPPPREREREQPRKQPPVQKTVVKRRRGMPLGCLIKLAILGLVGFGIYTGVNYAMAKINGASHDLNNWVSHEWHQIAQKINLEKDKLPDKVKPSINVPTDLPSIPSIPGGNKTP
ncbi:serine/threonine-protein kinase [Catenulispora subtropica]|uniref:non-specific serine/threonine protein kinase n=1 Tax=Catenulispora subtropica TaxID=450798 RepID=A0ABP5DJ93_9ACTN